MNRKVFISSGEPLKPEYSIDASLLGIQELCNDLLEDGDRICIDSEACLEVVYERLRDGRTRSAIDVLKNKFAFRSATAELFPELGFYKTSLVDFKTISKKSIIKPVRGFFSAGVRVLEPGQDIDLIKQDISSEIQRLSEYFPESVLSSDEWLIEDWIDGEEIAVDMYYARDGKPVILNITAHPMPSDLSYLNVIYWTNEELLTSWKEPLEDFFQFLNDNVLKVCLFPIHAEFRVNKGKLIPIEINPLRFGGFGLADLSYYGWGFNPYNMFFNEEVPKWDAICEKQKGRSICWILGYNGKNANIELQQPDHNRFIEFCGSNNLLHYRHIDWRNQPVFALAYLSIKKKEKIDDFLTLDFNHFFVPS